MLLLDISNHVVFWGVHFEFETQKFPISSCKKTGETFTKNLRRHIRKKIQHPLMKAKGFEQKESRMFQLLMDWPSRTFKEAFTGETPRFVGKKKKRGLAVVDWKKTPNLPRLPLRLAVPRISRISS